MVPSVKLKVKLLTGHAIQVSISSPVLSPLTSKHNPHISFSQCCLKKKRKPDCRKLLKTALDIFSCTLQNRCKNLSPTCRKIPPQGFTVLAIHEHLKTKNTLKHSKDSKIHGFKVV